MEHFGPGTEQLDIYSEDGRVSLTSYTEKVMSGSGKQSDDQCRPQSLIGSRDPQATIAHHDRHRHIGIW